MCLQCGLLWVVWCAGCCLLASKERRKETEKRKTRRKKEKNHWCCFVQIVYVPAQQFRWVVVTICALSYKRIVLAIFFSSLLTRQLYRTFSTIVLPSIAFARLISPLQIGLRTHSYMVATSGGAPAAAPVMAAATKPVVLESSEVKVKAITKKLSKSEMAQQEKADLAKKKIDIVSTDTTRTKNIAHLLSKSCSTELHFFKSTFCVHSTILHRVFL